MKNTLGLDDDLDGVDLLKDLELCFEIKITDPEATSCHTVGDIYELLHSRYSQNETNNNGCATAMAFYRLRRSFCEIDRSKKPQLTTTLDRFAGLTAKRLFKEIGQRSGLRLPRLHFTLQGNIGIWLIGTSLFGLLPMAMFVPDLWWALVSAGAVGFCLVYFDPGKIPTDCQTIGDLSRKVAGLNFGKLTIAGAGSRDRDLWSALVEVLSEHTTLPKTEINFDTLILKKQMRAA
jgi:hypothetical protein